MSMPMRCVALRALSLFCLILGVTAFGTELHAATDPRARKKVCTQLKLALYAKNPANWKIIAGGAKGVLSYDELSGRFNFTAVKLKPQADYVLVRYAETPPTADLLARGTAGKSGELRLAGTWKDWTNKIWLVSAADVTITEKRVQLTDWHPNQYLFEEKVLGVPCECDND